MKILPGLLAIFFIVTAPRTDVLAGPDDEKKIDFFVIHKDGGPGRIPIKVESLAIDAHCRAEPDMVVKGLKEVEMVPGDAGDGVPSLLIRLNSGCLFCCGEFVKLLWLLCFRNKDGGVNDNDS